MTVRILGWPGTTTTGSAKVKLATPSANLCGLVNKNPFSSNRATPSTAASLIKPRLVIFKELSRTRASTALKLIVQTRLRMVPAGKIVAAISETALMVNDAQPAGGETGVVNSRGLVMA